MKRRGDEIEFGSDSFLDVIANIVGILIILIVITGLRVRNLPLPARSIVRDNATPAETRILAPSLPLMSIEPPAAELPPPKTAPRVIHTSPPPSDETQLRLGVDPWANHRGQVLRIEPLDAEPPRAIPQLREPQNLIARVDELAAAQQQLQQRLISIDDTNANSARQIEQLQSQLKSGDQRVAGSSAAMESLRTQLTELQDAATQTEQRVGILQREVAEASSEPEATVREHRLTPVSRQVTGGELHFRLAGGRVSRVPVDELAELLAQTVQRQRAILLKQTEFNGEVGPLDGYRMFYRLEQMKLTLADELQYGRGVVRMQVSQWTLLPDESLTGESAETALGRDSQFYRDLMSATNVSTVTFWTYPDSFELHRRLQDFAHRNGFQVASRPLPPGVPITGSPSGAKSVAQ